MDTQLLALAVIISACTFCGWMAGRYFQQWLDQRETRRLSAMRDIAARNAEFAPRLNAMRSGGLN